jgi:DNA-binding MarR family transcriptional regulator
MTWKKIPSISIPQKHFITRPAPGLSERCGMAAAKRPARRPAEVLTDGSVDMQRIRASLALNCETFADDPLASSTAMDLMLTLRRTATSFQTMAETYTRDYDLSPARVVIVMALAATPGHALPQAEIGRELSVSLGNLTALLASLEAAGLVRRKTDTGDGRVTNISLTAKGLALVKRFAPVHYRTVAAALEGLTLAEQQTLITLLDKMRDQLKPKPKPQTATSPRKKTSS